jgi:hypothetical protein
LQVQAGGGRWRACFGFPGPHDEPYTKLPLAKFFSVTWQEYPNANPDYYLATGWLLMDFIFHGDGGAYFAQLPSIFEAVSQGISGPAIMAATFPNSTLDQLDEQIADVRGTGRAQLRHHNACPLAVPIAPSRLPDVGEPREEPVDPQEIERVRRALDKLPHGARFPSWYLPAILAGG